VSKTLAIADATQVTVSGTTVTLQPTGWLSTGLSTASYTVVLASGVVTDASAARNAFAGLTAGTFTFTTVDDAAPVLVSTVPAHGAVDVALWDLAGKIAGLPVHALMGTHRTEIGAYASSQLLPDAQAYVAQAQQHKQEGWAGYKIHPPADPDTDIKVCEAVRRGVGDSYPVMLDSTWSYDYYGALKVGLAIQEMGFKWYEDPLADEDILSYVKLRQKLNIPILATEYPMGGLDTYPIWIQQQATDYLRGDIPAKGGLTTMLKTAHLAEAFHMNYEVHHSGNSLNNLANLHVCMAIPNTTWFEVLLPDGAHRYGLEEEFRPDSNGMLQAPTGPGLGARIDFAMIKAKTEAVLE
jgi:L-alanine-DL-glutamate epimerase-like enolase superfamily enzyme